jgi:hypothetical protein
MAPQSAQLGASSLWLTPTKPPWLMELENPLWGGASVEARENCEANSVAFSASLPFSD